VNSIQHALMIAARQHIEERRQTNDASLEAAALWVEHLDDLFNSIKLWISPLEGLEGFSLKEIDCSYTATDSSDRENQINGRGLSLAFFDTEIRVTPWDFQVGGSLMTAKGVVQVFGKGLAAPYQIHYNDGIFEKMTNGSNELNFGELLFTQVLADEVQKLKP